ncbi:18219_t:CDS:2, partial [Cetraspora pellucida]
ENNEETVESMLKDQPSINVEEVDELLPDYYSSINVAVNTSQEHTENNRKSIEPILSDEKVDKLLSDSYLQINIAVNTSQTVSTDNQISLENEYAADNQ